MNIFIIGYRCTGKSSTGAKLAKKLGFDFIDADIMLVEKYKSTISDIVAQKGWDAFRKMEKDVTGNICKLNNVVVATGGGVILDPENIDAIKKSGIVIWLCAEPDTIYRRISGDEKTDEFRPSLTDKGLYKEVEETLDFRKPLYTKAMDFYIDTDNIDIDEVVDLSLKEIKKRL